jgi:hypothetical protein
MKKLVFITLMLMLSGFAFGQSLQKGNLISLHSGQPVLSPGVSVDQYVTFVKDKLIPAYEKNFPGAKCYILKSIRGECKNCVSLMFYFPSDTIWNKYFIPEGGLTELGQTAINNIKPMTDELAEMDKSTEDISTDWIIQ